MTAHFTNTLLSRFRIVSSWVPGEALFNNSLHLRKPSFPSFTLDKWEGGCFGVRKTWSKLNFHSQDSQL